MAVFDWKDNEHQYCADLVKAGGDKNVPAEAITSYLGVQIACALRDKRIDVVAALQTLKIRWEEGIETALWANKS